MTTIEISTGTARWQVRLSRLHDRLASTVAAFDDGETDWAPDVGIEDARAILWSLAVREQRLVRLLESREGTGDGGVDDRDRVDVGEILRLLDSTRGRMIAWLDAAREEDLHRTAAGGASIDDHLCEHLLGITEGVARMNALLQLIDPRRIEQSPWVCSATPA